MKIVSGIFRGRNLASASGEGYRPAMGKVREAVFSMIESRLEKDYDELVVADLFAGSGSLGFEALSRGAKSCLFVEMANPAAQAIATTTANFKLGPDQVSLQRVDVLAFLRKSRPMPLDLVFCDPPYGKNLAKPSLTELAGKGWLAPSALVLAEIEAALTVESLALPEELLLLVDRVYGQTRIALWKNVPAV